MARNTLTWKGHAAKRADGSQEEYVDHVLDDAMLLIARVPSDAIKGNQAVEVVVAPVRSPASTDDKVILGTYRIEAHGDVAKILLPLRPFWERCGVTSLTSVSLSYRTYAANAPPPDSNIETWKSWPADGGLDVEIQAVDADDHGASVGRKPKRTKDVVTEVCIHRLR